MPFTLPRRELVKLVQESRDRYIADAEERCETSCDEGRGMMAADSNEFERSTIDRLLDGLPSQVIVWKPESWSDPDGPWDEWLRCLKTTRRGDRQIVWEGAHGRGFIAVVDYGAELRSGFGHGVYEGWARCTPLVTPIPADQVLANPVLSLRFSGRGAHGLQGNAITLTDDEADAIDTLAGGLPPVSPPLSPPTDRRGWEPPSSPLPPEKIIEGLVSSRRRLWQALGFPEPPARQRTLPSGKRPDLVAPGVVAEVKRRISRHDGPAQIEAYIEELERTRSSEGPWRALLIQNVTALNRAARDRILESRLSIKVWAVLPGRLLRSGWRVRRLL